MSMVKRTLIGPLQRNIKWVLCFAFHSFCCGTLDVEFWCPWEAEGIFSIVLLFCFDYYSKKIQRQAEWLFTVEYIC